MKTTRRSHRKATSPVAAVATSRREPPPPDPNRSALSILEDLRYRLLEITALAVGAQRFAEIPAEGRPEHRYVVARLVCMVDMQADLTTAVLDDLDAQLATVVR